MNVLFKSILSLSLSGTLLIILMFLCKPLLKDRIGKRWQYYMWVIVIVRLLVPFSSPMSPVNALFQKVDRAMVHMTVIHGENGSHTLQEGEGAAANYGSFRAGGSVPAEALTFFSEKVSAVLRNLWLVWLAGAMLLLTWKIAVYQGFVKNVRAGCLEVSDVDLLNRLAQCGEQIGVKAPVELYINSCISSPMLIGFFKPCIVLPAADLSDSDFRYTILHELSHYRYRDMFYKWIAQITLCLHWFNPFVYLMCREINRACELACDETVISGLQTKEREAYGDMLLNAIGTGVVYHDSTVSMTLCENKEMIRERLGAIMNFKKKPMWVTLGSVILVIGLATVSTVIGAYAAPSDKPAEDTVSPISEDDLGANSGVIISLDEGVYYIFCDGADESDKPIGGVTEGSIAFVFVRKDGYTSISGFSDLETLVDDVTEQLEFMSDRNSESISREEANLLVKIAAKIQSGDDSDFVDLNIEGSHVEETWAARIKEYREWGIEKTDNAYYYRNKRVSLLYDSGAGGSMRMSYDEDGSVSIRLRRDERGAVIKVEYLTAGEVSEILREFDIQ